MILNLVKYLPNFNFRSNIQGFSLIRYGWTKFLGNFDLPTLTLIVSVINSNLVLRVVFHKDFQ
jgi:hypothetical protein